MASNPQAASEIEVPRQFAEDFSAVADWYGCSAEEIEEMKACAREHLDEAIVCFADLARSVRFALRLGDVSPWKAGA